MSLVNVYHLADLRVFFLCVCDENFYHLFIHFKYTIRDHDLEAGYGKPRPPEVIYFITGRVYLWTPLQKKNEARFIFNTIGFL